MKKVIVLIFTLLCGLLSLAGGIFLTGCGADKDAEQKEGYTIWTLKLLSDRQRAGSTVVQAENESKDTDYVYFVVETHTLCGVRIDTSTGHGYMGSSKYIDVRPRIAGEHFAGYYTAVQGAGTKAINADGTFTGYLPKSSGEVWYAHYIPACTVTLNDDRYSSTSTIAASTPSNETYDTDVIYMPSGVDEIYSDSYCENRIESIVPPTYSGYNFQGYYTATYGYGSQVIDAEGKYIHNVISGATRTLYAYYIAVGTSIYTITFDPYCYTDSSMSDYLVPTNYSSVSKKLYAKTGSNYFYSNIQCTTMYGSITVPTVTNWRFLGYYTAPFGQGTQIVSSTGSYSGVSSITSNIVLYANYFKYVIECTLDSNRYDSSGVVYEASNEASDTDVVYFNHDDGYWYSNYIATLPTMSGWVFQGYYTERNGEGSQVADSYGLLSSWNWPNSDMTYYAYWTGIETYLHFGSEMLNTYQFSRCTQSALNSSYKTIYGNLSQYVDTDGMFVTSVSFNENTLFNYYGNGFNFYDNAGVVNIVSGTSYTWSCYVRASTSGVRIGYLGLSDVGDADQSNETLTTSWVRYSNTFTATASQSQPFFRFLVGYMSSGTVIYIKGISVKKSSECAEYDNYADKKVVNGSEVGVLPTATRKGYEFEGWRKNYFDLESFVSFYNTYGNTSTQMTFNYGEGYISWHPAKGFIGNFLIYELDLPKGTYQISYDAKWSTSSSELYSTGIGMASKTSSGQGGVDIDGNTYTIGYTGQYVGSATWTTYTYTHKVDDNFLGLFILYYGSAWTDFKNIRIELIEPDTTQNYFRLKDFVNFYNTYGDTTIPMTADYDEGSATWVAKIGHFSDYLIYEMDLPKGTYQISYDAKWTTTSSSGISTTGIGMASKTSSGTGGVDKNGNTYTIGYTGRYVNSADWTTYTYTHTVDDNFLGLYILYNGGSSTDFKNISIKLISLNDESTYSKDYTVKSDDIVDSVFDQTLSAQWRILKSNVTVYIMTSEDGSSYSNSSTTGGTATLKYVVADGSESYSTASVSSYLVSQTVHREFTMTLTSSAKSGYVYCGAKTSNSKPTNIASSNSSTFTPTTSTMLIYVYFKKTSSNKIKYDSTEKYFYFEDGEYPQTYVGDTLNAQLNNSSTGITANTTADYFFHYCDGVTPTIIRRYVYTWTDGNRYTPLTASKTMTVSLGGTNYTFTSGNQYWFKVEPIRWRVSEYGVSSTAYPSDWAWGKYNTGFVAVTDRALGYSAQCYVDWNEGTNVHTQSEIVWGLYNCSTPELNQPKIQETFNYNKSATYTTNVYGSAGQQVVVKTSTATVSYYILPSEAELNSAYNDLRCKPSQYVAFQMGVSDNQYIDYWTREAGTNLENMKAIGKSGLTKNVWARNMLGYRFAMTFSEGVNEL